jgi:hypothetical protein
LKGKDGRVAERVNASCRRELGQSARDNKRRRELETNHVVSLEDLTLVGSSITVHGEGDGLLAEVLLGESDTGSDGDLSSDDTVSSEERGSEDVHRSSLSSRHTVGSS